MSSSYWCHVGAMSCTAAEIQSHRASKSSPTSPRRDEMPPKPLPGRKRWWPHWSCEPSESWKESDPTEGVRCQIRKKTGELQWMAQWCAMLQLHQQSSTCGRTMKNNEEHVSPCCWCRMLNDAQAWRWLGFKHLASQEACSSGALANG